VTDTNETLGEHVEEEAPQEFDAIEGHLTDRVAVNAIEVAKVTCSTVIEAMRRLLIATRWV
jgi:hypothetical protein